MAKNRQWSQSASIGVRNPYPYSHNQTGRLKMKNFESRGVNKATHPIVNYLAKEKAEMYLKSKATARTAQRTTHLKTTSKVVVGAAVVGGAAYGVHKYRAANKNPTSAAKPMTHSTTKMGSRVGRRK